MMIIGNHCRFSLHLVNNALYIDVSKLNKSVTNKTRSVF